MPVDGDRSRPRPRGVASRRTVASIASGTAPPNMPECEAWSSVRTREREARVAAQRDGERRRVANPSCPSRRRRSRRPAARRRCPRGSCANEREPYSSSPSMNSATPRSRSSPSASRSARSDGDVRHDAGLVVGGAAAVEPSVADGRLERRGLPQGLVARGLHVVVRVEQDGRACRCARPASRGRRADRARRCRGSRRAGSRRSSKTPVSRREGRDRARRCARAGSGRTTARRCRGCAPESPEIGER